MEGQSTVVTKAAKPSAEELAKQHEQREKAQLKRVKQSISDLESEEVEELAILAETELAKRETKDEVVWNHITEYESDIREAISNWGKVGGIRSGLPSFDAVIGGLRKGQVTLIAGESNQGKSALVAQLAVNISKKHKVGYISLEMLPGDNGARINHMNGGTDTDLRLEGLDIYFQSTTKITYKHLEPLVKQGLDLGIELFMLDYLQFLGRRLTIEEVGEMTQVIKNLSLDYKIPIVVVVSLRKGQQRKWMDVGLDDLMGTSAIGYDADNTIVVSHRDLEDQWDDDHIYIKVLKLRNMKRTRDNQFLMYDWEDTRITEPPVPLHMMIQDGDIDDEGRITIDEQEAKSD